MRNGLRPTVFISGTILVRIRKLPYIPEKYGAVTIGAVTIKQ